VSRPTTYLICWAHQPIGNPQNRRAMAAHYAGSTDYLARRLRQHRRGNGAAIMRAVSERGIPWFVVRTWPGGRRTERRIKRSHQLRRYCPMCSVQPWEVAS
jgi:predicted GIY-YIG superfamily endonuclease